MYYIPYTLDGAVEIAIALLWVIIGAVAVIQGWKKSVATPLLVRRAIRAVIGAGISLLLYSVYILQRQSVEAHDHIIFRKPLPWSQKSSPP